jgi:MoCo/4Fe-4S cofactor protein with predicted Tat translocation signal
MSRRKPYTFTDSTGSSSKKRPMWRSLEEKAAPEATRRAAEAELAEETRSSFVEASSLSRRGFLLGTGATAAATLSGCIRRPVENIMPYTLAPEHVIPGVPLHFATVTERRGDAIGLVVESHEGRPTKVEGNREHTGSLGATDVFAQAMIMDLYDPDRSRRPAQVDGGAFTDQDFAAFETAYRDRLAEHERDQGAGLRFLVTSATSPTLLRAAAAVRERFPRAEFHVYSAINNDHVQAGTRLAFGMPYQPVYDLEYAKVILSIDSDFLGTEAGMLRNARSFAAGRRLSSAAGEMNRLYVVEPTYSLTGAAADHRLRLAARRAGAFLRALAADLAENFDLDLAEVAGALGTPSAESVPPAWFSMTRDGRTVGLAAELAQNAGRSAIVVGARQPPEVHALAHAINHALGNAASQKTVAYLPVSTELAPEGEVRSIASLVEAIRGGGINTLVILGGNPVLDAPADLGFGDALGSVNGVFHLGSHRNETAAKSQWHCPLAHELERWGDERAIDGLVAIQQPLIEPLHHGARSPIELLGIAANERNWRGHGMVRKTFRTQFSAGVMDEQAWRSALHRGTVERTESMQAADLAPNSAAIAAALRDAEEPSMDGLEIVFAPSPKLWDGRHANNLWLEELPDPMTKIVWDNAAIMSPETAESLRVSPAYNIRRDQQEKSPVIAIRHGDATVEIPVWIQPGHANESITLYLGHGRDPAHAGRYSGGDESFGGGFNAYPLRTTGAFWIAGGVSVEPTDRRHFIAQTQIHNTMEGRPIAIDMTLDEYRDEPALPSFLSVDMLREDPANPDAPPPGGPIWRPYDYSEGHRWGMAIDLTTCTGCNACVIACQAENNIPTVGKSHVARGREMYWLRIDRYFAGTSEGEPEVALQPIACQHCEEAPCENVCPVNATTHSPEGLNDMAYNRCIGTRYCANNCPYKVRRFNYLPWHGYLDDRRADYDEIPKTRQMAFNPNVTVRMRGVIEKCTYCVQRIQEAKIDSKRSGTALTDGAIRTACQQVCPTSAIVFGDLNDPASEVRRLQDIDRGYKLLAELGTRPRTTFLGRVRNPNPDMAGTHVPSAESAPSEGAGGSEEVPG